MGHNSVLNRISQKRNIDGKKPHKVFYSDLRVLGSGQKLAWRQIF